MLGEHKHAILEFSGGKDSLAALYLARPYLDRITVMFGDTGGTFPHVVKFVQDTCAKLGAKLQIVRPFMPVLDYTEKFGLPSDIVPAWRTVELQQFLAEPPGQLVQSPMNCCGSMLLMPLYNAVVESGVNLVIRGAKKADKRVGVPPGHVDPQGITYTSPVWDWSDDDVFDYLKREGAELAPHYPGIRDSLDCWMCTGHLPYGDASGKLKYVREHYPELWPVLEDRLKRVAGVVKREQDKVDAVMATVIDGVM